MLHPIFSTVIQRPDLIAEHLSAYCEVFSEDAKAVQVQFVRRAIAGVIAAVFGLVFVSLSGVAVMLGFVQNQFHWSLVVVPSIALLVTVVAAVKAMQPLSKGNFAEFKAQLKSDVSALRIAS